MPEGGNDQSQSSWFQRMKDDPFLSKVAAGLLVLIIGSAVASAIPNGWHTVGTGISSTWAWMWNPPKWLLVILYLCALAILIVVGVLIRVACEPAEPSPPPQARQEPAKPDGTFFSNLKWRWYYDRDGRMTEIAPFCPTCDLQLIARQSGVGMFASGPTFYACDNRNCQNHGRELLVYPGTHAELETLLIREVQRQARLKAGT